MSARRDRPKLTRYLDSLTVPQLRRLVEGMPAREQANRAELTVWLVLERPNVVKQAMEAAGGAAPSRDRSRYRRGRPS